MLTTFYILRKKFCLPQGHEEIVFCCLLEALLCYLYILSENPTGIDFSIYVRRSRFIFYMNT